MAPTQPISTMWTIRFRHGKTTVLLHVDPLQNIASIKAELWAVLTQTESTDSQTNAPSIPDSPDEILLARPLDINDATQGWKGLTVPETSNGTATKAKASAKGKGKGREGAAVEGIDAESLKSLGIRDNALLAFKFVSSTSQSSHDEVPATDINADDEDEDMNDTDGEGARKESWDVIMPAWEDQYGVTNTGDAGALKEFEG